MDMNSEERGSTNLLVDEALLERMVRAVEKVRERLHRSDREHCRLRGSPMRWPTNAVAAWVSRVDESAVRNTQDVDILVRR